MRRAAINGHPEAAGALLIAGADIHAVNSKVLGFQHSLHQSIQWFEKKSAFFCIISLHALCFVFLNLPEYKISRTLLPSAIFYSIFTV